LGLRIGLDHQVATARSLVEQLSDVLGEDIARDILDADQSDESGIAEQRRRVRELDARLAALRSANGAGRSASHLASLTDLLVRKSVWIVGGDGWAYDIGYGGLDHVLASGTDVNILVLDTEVYSNTGGQASKATSRGAVAKFATAGKGTRKKDLGLLATQYGDVYVAQIALGANDMQTVRSLREAEAWPGPSLVLAYSTCIAHGVDMQQSMARMRSAVETGYWPLYRYRPDAAEHAHPFHLDSRAPTRPVTDFLDGEARFAILHRTDPERAAHLTELAQADVDERWRYYCQLAEVERRVPPESEDDEPDDGLAHTPRATVVPPRAP
jgi:pyruvate-ferredoxin/flavodoxin oxidoreductase